MDSKKTILAIAFMLMVFSQPAFAEDTNVTDTNITDTTVIDTNAEEICASMTIEEAISIAEESGCMEEGELLETYVCNDYTGTYWIDLEVEGYPLCNPACVVNIETGKAEINWRCTGAIPLEPDGENIDEVGSVGAVPDDLENTAGIIDPVDSSPPVAEAQAVNPIAAFFQAIMEFFASFFG